MFDHGVENLVSSVGLHATSATFGALPAARRR